MLRHVNGLAGRNICKLGEGLTLSRGISLQKEVLQICSLAFRTEASKLGQDFVHEPKLRSEIILDDM